MIDCPSCNSSCTEVLETRLCNNDTRRRRHCCQNCSHRWTTWDGPKPRPGVRMTLCSCKGMKMPDRLTDDQVRMILEHRDISTRQLARDLGRSEEAIRQVRRGQVYRDVLPEIRRWSTRKTHGMSCHVCVHWSGKCKMGFPDPEEEGLGFAADCSFYEPSTQSISRA